MAAATATDKPPRLALSFGAVTEKNVEQLKVLNRAIFPINYPERMYKDVLAFPDVTQVGLPWGAAGGRWGLLGAVTPLGLSACPGALAACAAAPATCHGLPVPRRRARRACPPCAPPSHPCCSALLVPAVTDSWPTTTTCWWAPSPAGWRRRRRRVAGGRGRLLPGSACCSKGRPSQRCAPRAAAAGSLLGWAWLATIASGYRCGSAGPQAVHPDAGRAGAVPRHGRRYRAAVPPAVRGGRPPAGGGRGGAARAGALSGRGVHAGRQRARGWACVRLGTRACVRWRCRSARRLPQLHSQRASLRAAPTPPPQVNNEEAIRFYTRHGFQVGARQPYFLSATCARQLGSAHARV